MFAGDAAHLVPIFGVRGLNSGMEDAETLAWTLAAVIGGTADRSPAQMLAHLTVNGAPSRTGDLFASGTISGPDRETRGAFIELTWGGAEPVTVGDEKRTFLEDGDDVVLTATAPGPNGTRLGFGEARARILPAVDGR